MTTARDRMGASDSYSDREHIGPSANGLWDRIANAINNWHSRIAPNLIARLDDTFAVESCATCPDMPLIFVINRPVGEAVAIP